jgi:hypothetical protein
MFENLIDFDPIVVAEEGFTPIANASPQAILDAKANTNAWLAELGVSTEEDIEHSRGTEAARAAFTTLTTNTTDDTQRVQLLRVKTPAAVQHLVGMLTAYDWEFVERAKEIRGYAVAQILEETKNSNPSVRLKALSMLGKITEVGLFTDKIEIKKIDASDAELDQRIKDKLARFTGVVDVGVKDVVEKQHPSEDL